MDWDTRAFIFIIIITIAISWLIIYFIIKRRSKKYIIYVDNELVRTYGKLEYKWISLSYIQYINKYVAGKGLREMNYAIEFHFPNGVAIIDRNSNIYEQTFSFSEKLYKPKRSRVTKGLFFLNNTKKG